ncbi:PilZ domain protein [Planctomycetes bacterium Pan216]|uniref:PilZ domain protein n=1 Tax=Kolteria novifilia TaxID=2527975 RepID=A0A518B750_9BACT|nr:PilZ domain protein [Planctomycetes bacterium Pan216]
MDETSGGEKKKTDGEVRRAYKRRTAKGIALCRMGRWGTGPEIKAKIVDVSQDGAAVIVSKPMTIGEEFEMELCGQFSRKGVRTRAVVRNVREEETKEWFIGCQFEKRLGYDTLSQLSR